MPKPPGDRPDDGKEPSSPSPSEEESANEQPERRPYAGTSKQPADESNTSGKERSLTRDILKSTQIKKMVAKPKAPKTPKKSSATGTSASNGSDDKPLFDSPTRGERQKKQFGRKPTKISRIYETEHYVPYDLTNPDPPPAKEAKFRSTSGMGFYDGYQLYSNSDPSTYQQIPRDVGIRIDDLLLALILENASTNAEAKRYAPTELDQACMPYARRIPLGNAVKLWVKEGEMDALGRPAKETGWYYKWWRGLHNLRGKEGYDTGDWLIRPSGEQELERKMYFRVEWKCVVQDPAPA